MSEPDHVARLLDAANSVERVGNLHYAMVMREAATALAASEARELSQFGQLQEALERAERAEAALAEARERLGLVNEDCNSAIALYVQARADLSAERVWAGEKERDAIKARADSYTRLLLIESYLEVGDLHSVRSAIQAWREELHKEKP